MFMRIMIVCISKKKSHGTSFFVCYDSYFLFILLLRKMLTSK